jgi:plasmid stability protein
MHNACMKNLQVRNVPEHTHAVLRRRAARAGMSLQEYLLSMLNDTASRPTVEEVLARIASDSGGRVRPAAAVRDIRAERSRR